MLLYSLQGGEVTLGDIATLPVPPPVTVTIQGSPVSHPPSLPHLTIIPSSLLQSLINKDQTTTTATTSSQSHEGNSVMLVTVCQKYLWEYKLPWEWVKFYEIDNMKQVHC